VSLPKASPRRLDLRAEGIHTIVVASGNRPHHPWLHLPIVAADGRIEQDCGVTALPGVYTVGQRAQHGRASGTIAGATQDASYVVEQIAGRRFTAHLSPEGAS
jgi:putative flavoprotein involved in K+ transport